MTGRTETATVLSAAKLRSLREKGWTAAAIWGGAHVLIGLLLHVSGQLGCNGNWADFWQIPGGGFLTGGALSDLWYMHAQPPLYTLYLALLFRIFPAHETIFVLSNVLMAGVSVALLAMILRWLQLPTILRRILLAVVLLHPALYVFAHYELYAVPTVFLATTAAAGLVRGVTVRELTPFVFALVTFALLILTRSAYQLPLLLLPPLLAVRLLSRPQQRRLFAVTAATLLLVGAWYVKNQWQYGFFGTSSWYGMNLYKVVLAGGSVPEDFPARETHGCVTVHPPFSPPHVYADCGYNSRSSIPMIDRDDQHNVNIPAVSAAYASAAFSAISARPGRHVAHAFSGMQHWFYPSSVPLIWGPEKHHDFRQYERRYYGLLGGRYLARIIGVRSDLMWTYAAGTILLLLAVARVLVRLVRGSATAVERAALGLAALVAYNLVVSSLGEFGENNRFKFDVELLLLAGIAWTLTGIVQSLRNSFGRNVFA